MPRINGSSSSNLVSVASVHFDGFGSEVAAVSEGFGGDGSDVVALTRRDALSRPVAVRSVDGDGRVSLVFTDCMGRTVLQRAVASGTNPSYTGRISQKTTISPNRKNTYDYFYDSMGRLIEARSSGFDNNGLGSFGLSRKTDHSTAYSYDLNGNILTLKRKGAVAFGLYGQIDDVTATYCGNQIATIRDDAADVLLESSLDMPHGEWSGSDFAYDRNGNQTRDLSRGVSDIQYNELNLPERVEMDGGGSIEYLYSAAGTKLAEIVRDEDDQIINRRDYAGMFEFESDSLRAIALASGFVSAADTTFHLYVHDYQGNVTGVYNTRSGALEQFTDFYPYGLPHTMTRRADAASNRRLYSAKELTTDHALNTYDFEARVFAPTFPLFTSVDPLGEINQINSLYIFCACDPVNLVDPSGMIYENPEDAEKLRTAVKSRIEDVYQSIEEISHQLESLAPNSKEAKKLNNQLQNHMESSNLLTIELLIIDALDKDPNHIYSFNDRELSDYHVSSSDGIHVTIGGRTPGQKIHEMTHILQSLIYCGTLNFINNMLTIATKGTRAPALEVIAYRMQLSLDGHIAPLLPNSISDITAQRIYEWAREQGRSNYDYFNIYLDLYNKDQEDARLKREIDRYNSFYNNAFY